MNRLELAESYLSFTKKHKIPLFKAWVSHGGSLVMHGMRTETSDIDVTVTRDIYTLLAPLANETYDIGAPAPVLMFDNDIDVHIEEDFIPPSSFVFIDGVQVTNKHRTLMDKLELAREKDQDDIQKLVNEIGIEVGLPITPGGNQMADIHTCLYANGYITKWDGEQAAGFDHNGIISVLSVGTDDAGVKLFHLCEHLPAAKYTSTHIVLPMGIRLPIRG